MDGYSVSEAASVLGVPIERVWELLARGVLSGAPEGATGMRVFLQPRPAPPVMPQPEPRPSIAANGGEGTHELSPFRELLTEFRNLTERYGQALLALGESRGEVASLRSRVDLLEARMDLRLPGTSPMTATGRWAADEADAERLVRRASASPGAPAPAMTAVDATAEATLEPPVEHEPEPEQRAAARGPRRATESFAEALARAEDPSLPELPGGENLAEAIAHRTGAETIESAEPAWPRELPPAEDVPVAEEPDEPAPALGPVSPAESEAEPVQPVPDMTEPAGEPTWDVDRYTADIEPTDWLEAEPHESDAPAASTPSAEAPRAAVVPAERAAASEEPFPGSADLGEAMAALRGPSVPAPTSKRAGAGPVPSSALRYRPVPSSSWPAGRAYRRLRRIFPS